MKKALILAALLLSSAAQAEIYFCDGKAGAVLELDKTSESLVDADFLISTTAGFKRTGPNEDYRGECQVGSLDNVNGNAIRTITCTDFTPFAADLIMMDAINLVFTRSLSFPGSSYTWTGQCSEL